MKAIQVNAYGGSEVLETVEMEVPRPGPGELLVKIAAAGVNFIDTYQRTGRYPISLPFVPGMEGAGAVVERGEAISAFGQGDRVAWASVQGSYAEYAVVPERLAVPVPGDVDEKIAAAAMLQGMTAHYLTESTRPLEGGETIVVHAAAGGVGLLLTQMAKRKGARVIGTVSTEEKAALAREAGADEVILYTEVDFESETRRLTAGRGADVVYDSVGKTTFMKSLSSLAPRSMLVLYGGSSGAVEPFDPMVLNANGSLFLTRPSLFHYVATREELLWRARDVFAGIGSGWLKVTIGHSWRLEQAADAHRALEGRATTGKVLLLP